MAPRLALRVLWGILCVIVASTARGADKVWAEEPFAAVEAGYDPSSKAPVYDIVVVALLMPPSTSGKADPDILWCSEVALGNWSRETADDLNSDALIPPSDTFNNHLARVDSAVTNLARRYDPNDQSTAVTLASVNQERANRIADVAKYLEAKTATLPEHLIESCGPPKVGSVKSKIKLMYTLERCPIPLPKPPNPCNPKGLQGTGVTVLRERAYAQFAAWFHSDGIQQHGIWVSSPHFDEVDKRSPVHTIVVPPKLLYNLPDVPMETRLSEFENLVNHLRSLPVSDKDRIAGISSAVPQAIGLSQQTTAHVIDLIQSPMDAMARLQDSATAGVQPLSDISDQVMRSRIMECVQLRRIAASATGEIEKCTGYKVNNDIVRDCLNGRRCIADFAEGGYASVVQIVNDWNLTELSEHTLVPRVGAHSAIEWEAIAANCAKKNADQPSDEQYEQGGMQCVLRTGMPSSAGTLDCIDAAGNNQEKLLSCVPLGDGDLKVASECWHNHLEDLMSATWCATESSLPAGVATCVSAFEAGSTVDAAKDCIKGALGNGAAGQLASCAQQYSGDAERAVVCMASPSLPHDMQTMASCGLQSSSWESFAGCAINDKLPGMIGGDVGKVLSCGMSAGGDPAGTAICLAGPKLTQDQQILLQCAVSTGGEPMSFATCTGGRLALREFMNCKDKHFAQGNCFGKNNDIRRIVRELGLGDISDSTVVGQYADKQLDVIKAQVAFAEGAINVGNQILSSAVQGLNGLVNEGERAFSNLGNGIRDVFHALSGGLL